MNESDELQDAFDRQMTRRVASVQTDRSGWTDSQWVDDARRLMNEPDGAVTSLLNGHASAMLRTLEARVEPTDRICDEHGLSELASATACDGNGSFHWWDDCKMVDVVRVPKEDEDGV